MNADSRKCEFWRWSNETDYQLMDESPAIPQSSDNTYVVAVDTLISYYVNDVLVASSGDYTMPHQKENKGQNTARTEGYFGLLNFNGDMTFQDTRFTPITDSFTPLLTDIRITSDTGSVEDKSQVVPTEPIRVQFVGNDASTVKVNAKAQDSSAKFTVLDEDGAKYGLNESIPVQVGKQYLTITSEVAAADGTTAAVTVTAGWTPSSSGGSTHPSRPSGSDSSSDRKPSDNSGKKDTEKQDAKPAPTPAEETNRQLADTSGYRDVPQTEWFAPAVNYVTANGIMTGNGNRFSPNEKLTRGMMAQILYNIAGGRGSGSANFPDIVSGDWFANAAGWAAEQGYIGGYSNGKLGPNDPITREQLAAIL